MEGRRQILQPGEETVTHPTFDAHHRREYEDAAQVPEEGLEAADREEG